MKGPAEKGEVENSDQEQCQAHRCNLKERNRSHSQPGDIPTDCNIRGGADQRTGSDEDRRKGHGHQDLRGTDLRLAAQSYDRRQKNCSRRRIVHEGGAALHDRHDGKYNTVWAISCNPVEKRTDCVDDAGFLQCAAEHEDGSQDDDDFVELYWN
jgi:hypothetical protein